MELRSIAGRLPFLNGVYVAIDAMPGACVIVDGPYCVATKAEMQYCHNLRSDLLPPFGRSRVVQTGMLPGMEEVAGLALDRREQVEKLFDEVCSWPEVEVVFATSFDFHVLLNFPLDRIGDRASKATGKKVLHVPSRSLGGDWLDGYGMTCDALAGGIDLDAGRRERGAVAIVGHLMDRTEPDQVANVAELKRLVAALGLETVCVWLSGTRVASLRDVERAEIVVSLPYAREAARTLGGRLEVEVIDLDLPVGLSRTERFVTTLGDRVGRAGAAREFVEKEVAGAIRDTERHVNRFIAGTHVYAPLTDCHLAEALGSMCSDVGAAFSAAEPGPEVTSGACERRVLMVAPTLGGDGQVPAGKIHFGYPDYLDHPVTARPFLGFAGYRVLVERMAEAALRLDAAKG